MANNKLEMNKKQALDVLSNGKRVRHTSAFPNDSIMLLDDRYYWEDGNSILVNAFWHHRTDSVYDDNWEEVSSEGLTKNEIEIIKNNELIAKFMGAEYRTDLLFTFTKKGWLNNPANDFKQIAQSYDFKYHSSWDWLIPVFNKCQELLRTMEGTVEVAGQHLYLSNSLDFLGMLNIEKVYIAVTNFIKWFNSLQIKKESNENRNKIHARSKGLGYL